MRNPRTAFETNSSNSNLATLNQNKFAVVGHGLINKTRGLNLVYTFDSANTMKPTTTKCPDDNYYGKIIAAMYGVKENDITTINTDGGATLPCSYMNLPMQLPIYYSHYMHVKRNDGKLGWQNINHFIEKIDASNLIGKKIVSYEFKPQIGFLSCPWSHIWAGRNAIDNDGSALDLYLYEMNNRTEANDIGLNVTNGKRNIINKDTEALTENRWKALFGSDRCRYISPIDMSQYVSKGLNTLHDSSLQPSVHIGVCPVPQLTTTNAQLVPDKFSDIECTFDITCEMVCTYGMPYNYTHFASPHVELEDTYMTLQSLSADGAFTEFYSTFGNKNLGTRYEAKKT